MAERYNGQEDQRRNVSVDRRNPQRLAMAAINTLNPFQSKIRDLATAGLGKHAGIVVGILRGGDQWVAGYGSFDAGQQPPDEDAIFEIGSVTKVFTTLVLAEMVLRGEVALDDPAQEYLPCTLQMPKWRGQEITLLHLATHTSSLPRLPRNLWKTMKDLANPYANYQVSDMYEFLSGYKLKRPIGSGVEYSNLGMGLLGHILGLAAGKSYEELVSERILRPLGMNHTSITLSPDQQGRLAPGHTSRGKVTANWDLPTLAGAGALRLTAGDVLRFVAASMNRATGPLAEAARLCQRLYPKTRKALPSWKDYALALLFSGLGVLRNGSSDWLPAIRSSCWRCPGQFFSPLRGWDWLQDCLPRQRRWPALIFCNTATTSACGYSAARS